MSLIEPKFASVAKPKKIGTISARLAVRLSEKGKTMTDREKLIELLHRGVRCPGTVASCGANMD
jgi:hypothetical protein